jgi:nucleolar protein 4
MDRNHIADVLVANVPADANPEEIEEIYADAGPVRRVAIKRNGRAILHFVLAADAQRCLETMAGRTLRGQVLNISLYAGDDPTPVAIKKDPVNTRLFRLIIRNLPFGVKEAAVRSVFQDFGRLVEVHLPTKPGPDGPVGRGFGFLQYSSKKEAKEAVDKGNGIEVLGRPVAVDWALGKEFYEAVAPPRKIAAQTGPAKEPPSDSKKRKATDKEEADKENATGPERGAAEKKKRKDASGGTSSVEDGDDEAGASSKKGEEETCAVFVRNVPLEATEQELAQVASPSIAKSCQLILQPQSSQ